MTEPIRDRVIRMEQDIKYIKDGIDKLVSATSSSIVRIADVERKQSKMGAFLLGVGATCSVIGGAIGYVINSCVQYFIQNGTPNG